MKNGPTEEPQKIEMVMYGLEGLILSCFEAGFSRKSSRCSMFRDREGLRILHRSKLRIFGK